MERKNERTSVGKVWRHWKAHTLLVEMYDGEAIAENGVAAPQRMKHRITIRPSESPSRFIHNGTETGT